MNLIRKPIKNLQPKDIIGVRDIRDKDARMLLIVTNNEDDHIHATIRKGVLPSYVFRVKDGISYPESKGLEIYMTPERRRNYMHYDEERRAKEIAWD